MKGELHTVANRRVEEVFDFLADIRNEKTWNPRLIQVEKTSSEPIGAGTTFQGRYQGLGVLTTRLTEFERPSRLSFHSIGSRMAITGTFLLDTTAGGTQVDLLAELQPRGLFRLMAFLMQPLIQAQNLEAGRRLKQALKQVSGPPSL
jgi:hypothetical protein